MGDFPDFARSRRSYRRSMGAADDDHPAARRVTEQGDRGRAQLPPPRVGSHCCRGWPRWGPGPCTPPPSGLTPSIRRCRGCSSPSPPRRSSSAGHAPGWRPGRGCRHRPGQRRCRRRLDRHQGVGHLVDRGSRAVRGAQPRRHCLRRPGRVGVGAAVVTLFGGTARTRAPPRAARAADDRSRCRHRRRHDVRRRARSRQ